MEIKCPTCGKTLQSKEEALTHSKEHLKTTLKSKESKLKGPDLQYRPDEMPKWFRIQTWNIEDLRYSFFGGDKINGFEVPKMWKIIQ